MSTNFVYNETIITPQSWFIIFDILSIIFTLLVAGFAIIFLFLIISTKIYRTVAMMLITNTCLAHLIFALDRFWMAIFRLYNDVNNIQYQDNLCIFRIYIAYISSSILNYSYFLQSIHRYISVVYSTHLYWQSRRIQFIFISITWIFSIVYPFIFLFNDQIFYDVHNHICQLPLKFSFSLIYVLLCSYIIPILLIIITYFKLILYIHIISKHVTPVNILIRARRQLKMVQNVVILIGVLFITGLPYGVFVFMSFFNNVPIYHCRFACVFFDVFSISIMIILFQFTDQLKRSLIDKIRRRRLNVIAVKMI